MNRSNGVALFGTTKSQLLIQRLTSRWTGTGMVYHTFSKREREREREGLGDTISKGARVLKNANCNSGGWSGQ